MKNRAFHKTLAVLVAGCLLMGGLPGALAQGASPSDFEAVQPLMDLVACAVVGQQAETPEGIPGPEGTLSPGFVAALMSLWEQADPSLGLTREVAADPQQQAQFLGRVFAAQLPPLEAVAQPKETNGYIGFRPVTVNSAADTGSIQLVGKSIGPKPGPAHGRGIPPGAMAGAGIFTRKRQHGPERLSIAGTPWARS